MPTITISSPTNPPTPVTVATNFRTYGDVNPRESTMSAWLQPAGGNAVQGAPVTPPVPGSEWTFKFPNLPTGTAYTLNVRAVDGAQSALAQVSITT
jgi:hypothetical protein